MSLFEQELLVFAKNEMEKALPLKGIAQPWKHKCEESLLGQKFSLPLYQKFLQERSQLKLEKILARTFSKKEYKTLHLPDRVIPKFYQKLPQIKNAGQEIIDEVKPNFADISSLKKHCLDKALLYLYEKLPEPKNKKVLLFTWVMNDGFGDYIANYEAQKILEEALPSTEVISFCLLPKKYQGKPLLPQEKRLSFFYETLEDLHFSHFPEEAILLLQEVDLILQIPTFYPYWEELLKTYSLSSFETLGEYGFVNSAWAHPCAPHTRCMGLHFLEKGIMIKDLSSHSWKTLSSRLQKLLFQDLQYNEKKDLFVFAYLTTFAGTYAFLHMLLSYFSKSEKDIYLAVTNLRFFIEILQKDLFPVFEYGIQEVAFYSEGKEYKHTYSSQGKTLRIIDVSPLSLEESKALSFLSQEIFACRGDQSFSEAISSNHLYFYDNPGHADPFLEDLVELAKNAVRKFPSSIAFLEAMAQIRAHKDDLSKLQELGKLLGNLLQTEETKKGIYLLNETIRKNYNVNPIVASLVKRALLHQENRHLQKEEAFWIEKFSAGEISFSSCIQAIQNLL